MNPRIAQDATARTFDKDGRMHISRSHIAKVGVNPYYGREIPDSERLGLESDRIYYLFRGPEELKKGAATFARNQILNKHVPVDLYDKMDADERKTFIVGAIGSDIEFCDPYIDADTSIWDASAIAGIETDTIREFSPAYHYKPVMIPGEYQGQRYDGSMTEIHGNHLCLVEAGRQGPDVLAADSKLREPMKHTKLGTALIATLGTAFPKMALDSAFEPLLSQATKKTFDKPAVRAKLIAMDKDAPAEKLDTVMDAVMDVDTKEDETEEEKKKRLAKEKADKPAQDEDDDEDEEDDDAEKRAAKKAAREAKSKAKETDEKVKTAMDSMRVEMRQELRDAEDAKRSVRPIVGDVIAQDTAEEIYGFALDHLKVDRTGVTGVAAHRALFAAATAGRSTSATVPTIAQDSAGLVAKFPNAARFRSA